MLQNRGRSPERGLLGKRGAPEDQHRSQQVTVQLLPGDKLRSASPRTYLSHAHLTPLLDEDFLRKSMGESTAPVHTAAHRRWTARCSFMRASSSHHQASVAFYNRQPLPPALDSCAWTSAWAPVAALLLLQARITKRLRTPVALPPQESPFPWDQLEWWPPEQLLSLQVTCAREVPFPLCRSGARAA